MPELDKKEDLLLEDYQHLLNKIGAIINKFEKESQKDGKNFNIFEIANISTAEVTVCRVLCELLSPTGSHGQGGAYLEIFLRDCLHLDITKDETEKARVIQEYPTDTNRRIDIVIETETMFIPIEVKIYAGDQPGQCYDYYQFAQQNNANKKSGRETKLYYLTRYRSAPLEDSAKGLRKEGEGYVGVVQLSWAHDIIGWLEECMKHPDTIRKAPIIEILKQFVSAIKKFTDQLEDKPKMEIVKLLSESEENMRNAIKIRDSIEDCRAERIKKFYNAVQEKLKDEMRLKRLEHHMLENGDYECQSYVDPLKSCMNYIVKHIDGLDLDLTFRIEIESNLLVGFGLAKNKRCIPLGNWIDNDNIKTLFNEKIDQFPKNSWYIAFDNVKFGYEKDKSINFKDFNDNYLKLFNKNTFNEIVDVTVDSVRNMLDTLK